MFHFDRFDTWLLKIPTRRVHTLGFGAIREVHHVVVRVQASDGAYGWGESTVLGGPTWSEESAYSIFNTINKHLIPLVIENSNNSLEMIRTKWDANVRGNPFAKAAVEVSLLDLDARQLNIPLYQLLGGKNRDTVPLSWSLASGSPEEEIDEANGMIEQGFSIFKIKMGHKPVDDDVRRVAEIQDAIGDRARIRVDANQSWTRAAAFRAVGQLRNSQLDFIEQPLPSADIQGMARIQQLLAIPLVADESLSNLRDAIQIAQLDAARIFSLKVSKHGGIVPSLQIAALARAMSIECYVGCMIETGIGTAAYAQLCAALPLLEHGCELFGPILLHDDVLTYGIEYRSGEVVVPEGPGLGIEVDIEKLSAYAELEAHHVHNMRQTTSTN